MYDPARHKTNVIMINVFIMLVQYGDLTYKLNPSYKPGMSANLQPIFRFPYLVIKAYCPDLYLVQDKKLKLVALHDRLLSCNVGFTPIRVSNACIKF